jgi:hypothetical protein
VTPSGNDGGSSRGILHEINQQYLRLKYKFKEGVPLKEYLQQIVPNLGETYTLREVLTWLKEIIRDNLLFDENNPSIYDSWGCTAGGSVEEKESAGERDPE